MGASGADIRPQWAAIRKETSRLSYEHFIRADPSQARVYMGTSMASAYLRDVLDRHPVMPSNMSAMIGGVHIFVDESLHGNDFRLWWRGSGPQD